MATILTDPEVVETNFNGIFLDKRRKESHR